MKKLRLFLLPIGTHRLTNLTMSGMSHRHPTEGHPMSRKPFYAIEAFNPGDPGYLAIKRVSSRRKASRIFGTLRSKFPDSTVTLNRRVPTHDLHVWETTTHRHIDGRP